MASIELVINGRKYELSGEGSDEHLRAVAQRVMRKLESLQKARPTLSLQKVAILAAFDFASRLIEGEKKGAEYRTAVLGKAQEILGRVESELTQDRAGQ